MDNYPADYNPDDWEFDPSLLELKAKEEYLAQVNEDNYREELQDEC